jgi:hypothetical protein
MIRILFFLFLTHLIAAEGLELSLDTSINNEQNEYIEYVASVRIINNSTDTKWIVYPELFLNRQMSFFVNNELQKESRYAIIDFFDDFWKDIIDTTFYKLMPMQSYSFEIKIRKESLLEKTILRVVQEGIFYHYLPSDEIELIYTYFVDDMHKKIFRDNRPHDILADDILSQKILLHNVER